MIIHFGAGDIAEKGIKPLVGGILVPKDVCDVRDSEQVIKILEQYRPETVVVTAGVSHPSTIFMSVDNDWREELETNLIGAFNIAKYGALAGVRTFIFIASVAGMYGKPNHAAYSASKGGVISLVQSMSMEGYDAYAISPGRVDTKMRQKDYPEDTPGSRLKPTEVGEVVKDILAEKYEPGSNLIIRKIGMDTQPILVDEGAWKDTLKVGQPVTI